MAVERKAAEVRRDEVDGIPVLLAVPEERTGPVALWLSHMGGSKEQCLPILRALAARGLPAVSFDAVEHGGRATRPPMELMALVQADPRQLWAILGGTALDAPRVLDWAAEQVGGSDVLVAGGVSL